MQRPTRDTTEIWILLNVVHRRVTQRFEASLRGAGLPPPTWYDLLWALECRGDGMRQFELERVSLFDQPNLSRTLKQMIAMGLVAGITAPEDRRGRILTITAAGREMRQRIWQVYGALMISEIEDRISGEAARGLIDGLARLAPDFEIGSF